MFGYIKIICIFAHAKQALVHAEVLFMMLYHNK